MKIQKMIDKYYKFKKLCNRNSPSNIKSKDEFLQEPLKCFWVSNNPKKLRKGIKNRKDRKRTFKRN